MTKEELRVLFNLKEAAKRAYNEHPSPTKIADPDKRFEAEIEERRLLMAASKAAVRYNDAVDKFNAS